MNSLRLTAVCALAVAACHADAVTNSPVVPLAGIHFVNAVPDTSQMDYRVVDIPSNAGLFDADFRASNMFYQGIEAGSREIRVFYSSTNPSLSSLVLWDTTFSFTQDLDYTFIHTGFARTGQIPARTVWIIQDIPPTPPAGEVGFRFIHAGAALGNVDINVLRHGSDTLPDVPMLANVAYGTISTYQTTKADSITINQTTRASTFYDTLRVVVTAAGTKTPRLFTANAPLGAPGFSTTPAINPIPGAAIPGSVMSVVIVPRSVAGSAAPQGAAFTVPTALYLVDKRPPNTAP